MPCPVAIFCDSDHGSESAAKLLGASGDDPVVMRTVDDGSYDETLENTSHLKPSPKTLLKALSWNGPPFKIDDTNL